MTMATTLPSVLTAPHAGDSLSMERALKQIRDLLNQFGHELERQNRTTDRVDASLDAIDTMLKAVDRG